MIKREKYDKYEGYLKVPRLQRMNAEDGIAKMIAAFKDAGVVLHEGRPPMSDVNKIVLYFKGDGDFKLTEVVMTGDTLGCYMGICLEPYPNEENEQDET